jgi:hypothetical protein
LTWQEQWWPLPGLAGLTWANAGAAVYISQIDNTLTLSLLAPQPIQGKITVLAGDSPLFSQPFSANPARPTQWTFPAPGQPLKLQLTAEDGAVILDYQVTF